VVVVVAVTVAKLSLVAQVALAAVVPAAHLQVLAVSTCQ
jgi:hypothetical protein